MQPNFDATELDDQAALAWTMTPAPQPQNGNYACSRELSEAFDSILEQLDA